jgi:alkyl sulfatase BDS1-like metallo-beta-lactamase superfamily hydrolase
MGGADTVIDAAKKAHGEGDHQFAAELAQLAVRAIPDDEDAKLVKAAALRALGYQELNPIARSWYLTGALELEGSLDPNQIIQAMMGMLIVEGSAMEIVKGWRYWLDAEAAGDTRLTVGLQLTDSGEEITVRLRNSVLNAEEGIADDADAVVALTTSQLTSQDDGEPAETVSGDPEALQKLIGYLDREIVGFHMHQR